MSAFTDAVAQLLPFLPAELAAIYADAWVQSGDRDIALATLNASPELETHFPGIKRPNGSLRLSILEYIGTIAGYEDVLLEVGVNPGVFTSQMADSIAGEKSVNEFRADVQAVESRIASQQDELIQVYGDFYGIGYDKASLIASVLSPDIGQAIIDRRITIAEIGGEAALSGFNINRVTATRLQQFGVDRQTGRQTFRTAAEVLPGLSAAGLRQGEGEVGLSDFLAAEVEGDVKQRRRLRRTIAGEKSDFTENLLFEGTEGALKGLRAR